MGFVRPAKSAIVRCIYSFEATLQYEMITYYKATGTPTAAPGDVAGALALAMGAVMLPVMQAVLVDQCDYTGTDCNYWDGTTPRSDFDATQSGSGDVSGDFQPPQVSVILRKTSNSPGRGANGRWFVGLVPELLTTGYSLNAAGETAYAGVAAALKQTLTAAGTTWTPQHYSPKNATYSQIAQVRVYPYLKRRGRRELHPLLG